MIGRRSRGRAKGSVDRRIFVVGVPRSGTTLVQSLLAAHSQMMSFTESHFFSRHFKPLPWASSAILTQDPTPRLRTFLDENGMKENDFGEDDSSVNDVESSRLAASLVVPARPFLPFQTFSVARQLLWVLDQLALHRGKPNWIEKTPKHLRYIPFLERLSASEGDFHFVHVIREGLEVVASLHEASRSWERAYDLETCIERWNADVGFSLGRVGLGSDHFVFYEQLTARPEATLQRLLAALGLDWEPEILERYSSNRLVTGEETWKANIDRGVRRSGTSGQVLSEAQRARVRASLRHDLYTGLLERSS